MAQTVWRLGSCATAAWLLLFQHSTWTRRQNIKEGYRAAQPREARQQVPPDRIRGNAGLAE